MIHQARQRLQQGFGQVVDGRLNAVDTLVGEVFPGLAHGKQVDGKSQFFEQ